jgi:LmbE family N-acetylglucosaminyl deacetylase
MKDKRVLVISPHPDDETLGIGGTIAKFSTNGCFVSVLTVAGHRPPVYPEDEYPRTVAEAKMAHAILGVKTSVFLDIPATTLGQLPSHSFFKMVSDVVAEMRPHIVLLPFADRHIDHRHVFEAGMVATRPIGFGREIELIAAYETLSSTHWNAPHIEPNFTPNWTNNITGFIDKKLAALKCYVSQIPPFPGARSVEAIEALAKFRGTQAGFAFGEALHIIRMCS